MSRPSEPNYTRIGSICHDDRLPFREAEWKDSFNVDCPDAQLVNQRKKPPVEHRHARSRWLVFESGESARRLSRNDEQRKSTIHLLQLIGFCAYIAPSILHSNGGHDSFNKERSRAQCAQFMQLPAPPALPVRRRRRTSAVTRCRFRPTPGHCRGQLLKPGNRKRDLVHPGIDALVGVLDVAGNIEIDATFSQHIRLALVQPN